jgi:hypothetical protein
MSWAFVADKEEEKLLRAPTTLFPSYKDALIRLVKQIGESSYSSLSSATSLLRSMNVNDVSRRKSIQDFKEFKLKREEFVRDWPQYAETVQHGHGNETRYAPKHPLKFYLSFTEKGTLDIDLAYILLDFCKAFAPGFEFHLVHPNMKGGRSIPVEPTQHTAEEVYNEKGWIRDEDFLDAMDAAKEVIPKDAYGAITYTTLPVYEIGKDDDDVDEIRLVESSTCLSTEHLDDVYGGTVTDAETQEPLDWDRYTTVLSTARIELPDLLQASNGIYPDGSFYPPLVRRLLEVCFLFLGTLTL